ncbi:S46 family peptidase [Marinilabiliaceae bacterium JC017]|nr:S46 family peptidase [Marinilabiliaceae bacterium JC017]
MIRYIIVTVVVLFSCSAITLADEGMWLPYLMDAQQIEEMQTLGLDIPYKEIFDTTHPSIKDAVVALDDGSCTGEFISSRGLLLTNHHCGFDEIQQHSAVTHDYLHDGFWAETLAEELINPGKTATILIDAKDVTAEFNHYLSDSLPESQRLEIVDSLSIVLEDEAMVNNNHYEANVKSFFNGSRYILFITQTFRDVRLVGTPPSSIGKFGGDEDNWVWPRHTGDFCFFRVYCSPQGEPADYSPDNIPFTPKKHLSISLDGIKEHDFTMVMGYPGETNRFLTSYGIEQIQSAINPVIAEVRGIKQDIWRKEMNASHKVEIKYAAKYTTSSNYWKYSIGQNLGLKKLNVLENRKTQEATFKKWVAQDSVRQQEYGKALPMLGASYMLSQSLANAETTTSETILTGPDLTLFILTTTPDVIELSKKEQDSEAYESLQAAIKEKAKTFYKDYDAMVDQKVFSAMMNYYFKNIPEAMRLSKENLIPKKYKGNISSFASDIYKNTLFNDSTDFFSFLEKANPGQLFKDPVFKLSHQVLEHYYQMTDILDQFDHQIDRSMRLYVNGLKTMKPEMPFYPDANSTMRLSYGTVGAYLPRDGVKYKLRTTLEGILEKEDTTNVDFMIPANLKKLYKQKDFGRYEDADGKMPVCFISDNDITGGNSGSPVLNKDGNLVGVAFDGNWEAMTGDLAYEKKLQKCINVDIRYVLFVVDKVAGASHLIDEMTIL